MHDDVVDSIDTLKVARSRRGGGVRGVEADTQAVDAPDAHARTAGGIRCLRNEAHRVYAGCAALQLHGAAPQLKATRPARQLLRPDPQQSLVRGARPDEIRDADLDA